jgi:5,10-methenyltetrahydromethanopterin hydrogenase
VPGRFIAAFSISIVLSVALYELVDINEIFVADSHFIGDPAHCVVFHICEEKEFVSGATASCQIEIANQLQINIASVKRAEPARVIWRASAENVFIGPDVIDIMKRTFWKIRPM